MNTGSGSRYSFPRFRLAFVAAGVFTCLSSTQAAPVEIVAHRGGYQLYPENTLAAFQACSGLVERIELDVRTTADGELVVMHDETVNRTTVGYQAITNESGVVLSNVVDLTLAQLKTLDAGSKFSPAFAGERIPTFAEALRALPPGIPVVVHMKACSASNVVGVLRAENALSNAIAYCDSWNFLYDAHALEPGLALCAGYAPGGYGELTPARIANLKRAGIYSFACFLADVTREFVDLMHFYGMEIQVAAANPGEVQTLLDLGVDRILVGNPALAKALIRGAPSSNAQLSQNLVAYWKFDEGLSDPAAAVADDIEDHSPVRRAGAAAAPTWTAGDDARGGALAFDGTNDYALVPTNEFLNIGTNAVSISAWVKLSRLPLELAKGYACIFDDRDKNAYVLYLDRQNRELRFRVTDSNGMAARPGIFQNNLKTGVWHHVVGVYDGAASPAAGQALIYLDGVLQDVHVGDDGNPRSGLTNLVCRGQAAAFGRNGLENDYYFNGAVDDVAIWNRALSPAEVRQIYSAGTNGIPLERKVMVIWIADVYADPETSDMVMDVRVDHGSMTNLSLDLRGAPAATEPYTQRVASQNRQGHHASFRVPRPGDSFQPRSNPDEIPPPIFFQVVSP